MKRKEVILTGDLNVSHQEIDLFSPKTNEKNAGFTIEERNEFTNLLEIGLVDVFRYLHPKKIKYSYFSNRSYCREQNKGWRLDYFLISKGLLKSVINCDILEEYYGSDHLPIKLELRI